MAWWWYGIQSTPRSYAYKLPKKVRRLAIKSALATKVVENNIVVLEDLVLNAPKQKTC